MYFGIALALMLSGASSASINDDNPVVNSNFFHRNRRDDAVSATSSVSKKGRSFVVSSSNYLKEKELLTSKTIHSAIGSRKIRNNDHNNKDKTDVLRVISTADSKTFEVCDDFGLINSCSSAEEVCVPLTEQQSLPFSPEDLVTNLTNEEKTEHGVCLDLSLIQATDSLQRKDYDTSAAATVADDEGIYRLSSASGHDLLYASDRSSLYIKEEDTDKDHHRGLESDSDCEATGRPAVTVTGSDFQQLIYDCYYSGNDVGYDCTGNYCGYSIYSPTGNDCPTEFKDVPLDCWDTSGVDDMSYAFQYNNNFNQPLESWNVSEVTSMNFMFSGASIFNQPLESWDISKVAEMRYMFYYASSFNQPLESWDVSKVADMGFMFSASEFNQCLSTWADKTPNNVDTIVMFLGSYCPLQDDPITTEGPWCQGSDICPAKGQCSNSEETFIISKKKSITCTTLESFKKGKRKKICKIKAALESCPVICNMKCTCKDNKTFIFNQKKYKCKKAGRKGQPQCNDEVNEKNKVSDLCPNKCGTCYESE